MRGDRNFDSGTVMDWHVWCICIACHFVLLLPPFLFYHLLCIYPSLCRLLIKLTLATVPTAVFLMFGTRKDVWSAWCFWRRRKSASLPIENRHVSIKVTLATETCTDNQKYSISIVPGPDIRSGNTESYEMDCQEKVSDIQHTIRQCPLLIYRQ